MKWLRFRDFALLGTRYNIDRGDEAQMGSRRRRVEQGLEEAFKVQASFRADHPPPYVLRRVTPGTYGVWRARTARETTTAIMHGRPSSGSSAFLCRRDRDLPPRDLTNRLSSM